MHTLYVFVFYIVENFYVSEPFLTFLFIQVNETMVSGMNHLDMVQLVTVSRVVVLHVIQGSPHFMSLIWFSSSQYGTFLTPGTARANMFSE